MSWLEPAPKSKSTLTPPAFDGDQALRLQMGLASPLWLMFMGAAGAGLAAAAEGGEEVACCGATDGDVAAGATGAAAGEY